MISYSKTHQSKLAILVLLASAALWNCQVDFLSATVNRQQLGSDQQREKQALKRSLQEFGLTTDRVSIEEFLKDLNDPNPDWSDAKKLIRQLGSRVYFERIEAAKSLASMVPLPIRLLQQASTNSDPEIAYRAAVILQTSSPRTEALVANVLRTINAFEIENLCSEVVATSIRFASNPKITTLAKQALQTTSTEKDIPLLSIQMDVRIPIAVRKMAIATLRKFEKPELADPFSRWCQYRAFTDVTRLECALALADVGDRRAMSYLKQFMLAGENVNIRARSKVALQRLTGKKFAFSMTEDLDTRQKQIVAWGDWIDSEGKKATLNFPLRKSNSIDLGDCYLIAMSSKGKVMLLDEALEEVWSIRCSYPRSVEKMNNGNILIGSRNRVFEVTLEKEIVREHKFSRPTSEPGSCTTAQPLENGNVLMVQHESVAELEDCGKVVWQLEMARTTCDAIRLENGNTLVSGLNGGGNGSHFLEEYDRSKKLVWKLHSRRIRFDSITLSNDGNILITDINDVVAELDYESKSIINRKDGISARDAFRLPNRNTLFLLDDQGPFENELWFHEVDVDGRTIRSKSLGKDHFGSIRR